jgi:16S rRNA G966 N2-methylase RsmD
MQVEGIISLMGEWRNRFYSGDDIGVFRNKIGDESIDLIYLDPPFNSVGADLQVGPRK